MTNPDRETAEDSKRKWFDLATARGWVELAGAAVAVVGAAVTVYFQVFPSKPPSAPKQAATPSIVVSGSGNVAAGRDVITTNISGYTIAQHEERLKKREMELRAEFEQAAQDSEAQAALKEQIDEVQGQLADVQTSYDEQLSALNLAGGKLQKVSDEIPAARMEEAAEALGRGDPTVANALLVDVVGDQGDAEVLAWNTVWEDQFDGEELSDSWEVVNASPPTYVVEDGKLLAWSSKKASLVEGNIDNMFTLRRVLPEGDWRITAKIDVDFQTGNDRVFFGLYDDKDNFVVTYTSTVPGQCVSGGSYRLHFYLTRAKALAGELTEPSHEVWNIPHCEGGTLNTLMDEGQPYLVRMRKIGRSYLSSIMLQGADPPKWIDLPGLTLRDPPGDFAMGVFQADDGEGETSLAVDWIKLETK